MSVERFEEGNRLHVTFHSFGGDLIDGDVIEIVKHPKRTPASKQQITVTVETRKGEERFTFLGEAAWLKAVGQQPLFENEGR
jgi:hypothetical protein